MITLLVILIIFGTLTVITCASLGFRRWYLRKFELPREKEPRPVLMSASLDARRMEAETLRTGIIRLTERQIELIASNCYELALEVQDGIKKMKKQLRDIEDDTR